LSVRLRLRRMGKKKQPFYRIVAIDSRVKRDGRYLENLGYYNPIKDPIELKVNAERALYWLQTGAQPSDTVRSLFRKTGVMLRFDLIKRGKSESEIESEVKKWEEQQAERLKKLEAARTQAERDKAKAEAKKAKEEEKAKAKAEADAEAEAAAETEETAETAAEETASEEKSEKAESAEDAKAE